MASRAVDLVGRRAELSWLRERLRLAAQGSPQCVLLSGEAGIGKTRLAAELSDDAHVAGFLTLAGRGYDGVPLPFLPFREAIFPALARLLDDGAGVPNALMQALGEEEEARSRELLGDIAPVGLLLELVNLVLEAATRRQLLLVVDDLHWADSSSLALVRHLVYRLERGFPATPLLLLLAARPAAEVEPLRREHRCAAVELAGLDALESADLVRRLGGMHLPPGDVWEQTGGNPFLIEALARSGSIIDAPLLIEAAIDARMESLSARCVELLEWAALLIPDLSLASLRRLRRWDEETLVALVDEALLAGALVVDGMSLRFTHPLVRARYLRRIGPLARARAHAEIAHALGPPERSSVVSVARHLVLAGTEADADEVAEVARAAAQQASALCAWEEAAGLYRAVLAAQPRRSEPAPVAERAALHWAVGKCRQFALHVDGGRRDFERAAELSRSVGDLQGETRATIDRLVCLTAAGPVPPGEVRAVDALVEALGASAPSLSAEALVDMSQAQWSQGRVDEARVTIARALEIAEPLQLHAPAGRAYVSRAITYWITLDLDRALDDLRRGEAHVRLAEDTRRRMGPAYRLPLTLLWMGRLYDAEKAVERATAHSEEVQSVYEYGLVLAARVSLAILRGDLTAAEEHADRALRIQGLSGYLWAAGLFLPALALARLDRGDADGAKAALDRWDETADDLARVTTSLLRTLVAVRCGAAGREALPRMPRMLAQPLLGAQDWAILSIEIARELQDPALAANATDLVEATLARGMVVSSSLPVLLSRAAATGHALLGRAAEARLRFSEAIRFADDHGAHAEGARARLGLARLEAQHDPAVAVVTLRQALPVLERLAPGPILAEAGRLAERLGMGAGITTARDEPITEQASVLFLDVVDSTRLTEEWGDVTYRNKARSLEHRLRLTIVEHGGTVMPGINLGDGLVALFRSSDEAVHGALAAVRASQGDELRLHLGVHHGSVLREGDAVYGSAVNIAARVCALSSPDEVLVSATSHRHLTSNDVPGIAFVDRGTQRLKGLSDLQHVFAVVPAS